MKSILLIEDNDEIRDNTAEILELSNYRVYTAPDGKKGVEIAIEKKPDLIVCDIMMPVLDGYGVLHMLHNNPDTRNTPFIFLTAKTDRTDIRKGMELGADDYITKPFSGTELLNAIEGRLRKRDFLQQEIEAGLQGVNSLLSMARGEEAIKTLVENRNINKYRKKQVIYAEGNRPSRMYFILKGKVKTFKTNEEGKELVINLYSEGDFLGYVALLEETNYKESAEAIEECELAVIPKEDFDELMRQNREVASTFIKLLARNVTEMENHLLGLAYNSLRKKVAQALITYNSKQPHPEGESGIINVSRENLATLAGTATESLIRTLSDFRNEKLIDIRNGKIMILNEKRLEHMIN